ncbi:MAG TPA: hypothetical protein VH109_13275 [Steroidobacteraceae bacterium]|jgi:hypothetical protein|nr:hypothetical protein [Steroidobacteraceae bacterium]
MELHHPGSIRTLREFLTHLVIVTLGILIALGLEAVVDAHHRKKLAAEAVDGFRHELTDNRAQVAEVLARMPRLREQIDAQIGALGAPAPPTTAGQPIKYPGITFDLMTTASWDTAIATQALNDIPYARVRGYSEAYGVLRLFVEEERIGFGTWQDLRIFGDDASRLSPEQRRALIEQLRRYENFTHVIDTIGRGALQSIDGALR